ncbi:MAG: helix-turn-helix domain-containing protein [Gallionellaceae bacterium]
MLRLKPNATKHQPSADNIRALISGAGLSQRGAARLIGINERTMRKYCKDGRYPYLVQFALECLVENNTMK